MGDVLQFTLTGQTPAIRAARSADKRLLDACRRVNKPVTRKGNITMRQAMQAVLAYMAR